jgi:nucleotide-binding universal stress UspA family protein
MGEAWAYGGSYLNPAWDEEALAGARRYVAGLAERVRSTCPDVEGRAEIGDTLPPITSVVERITTVAEQTGADMIVMSTHAHTGPVRALLGSVADVVVRTARRPVLLVRRSAPLEEQGPAALDRPGRALEASGRG